MNALNTQECWDSFTDKVDYAIEKLIPIIDKNKSTSKDWVNSKVRYERKNKNDYMMNDISVLTDSNIKDLGMGNSISEKSKIMRLSTFIPEYRLLVLINLLVSELCHTLKCDH